MSYALSPEQFVDYLIERRGLVDFVDTQLSTRPEAIRTTEDWQAVTMTIWHLSDRLWTPSPDYVIDMYLMQKERHRFWESHPDSQIEKWRARYEHWKERATTAEARLAALEKKLSRGKRTVEVAIAKRAASA